MGKHFDRPLGFRAGDQAGRQQALAYARAYHNNAAAISYMLQRRVGSGQCAAEIDVDHAVHFLKRGFLELFRNCRAGIVHEDIELAEVRDGLFDRGLLIRTERKFGPKASAVPLCVMEIALGRDNGWGGNEAHAKAQRTQSREMKNAQTGWGRRVNYCDCLGPKRR